MNAQPGLLAKKLGMTQLFLEDGTRVPVTVLQVKGNTVLAHRTAQRDGYVALQVAFDEQKPSRLTKPDLGRFKQAGVSPRRLVREFRCESAALEQYPVGSDIPSTLFTEGGLVDVTGTSKGKGFQGVMKRHKMRGKPATHGVHEYYRHGGSVGCRLTPGRIFPGKRMGGHMGSETKTVQNLRVAKVDPDLGVVLVRGAVPGHNGAYVTIRTAHKPALRQAHKDAKKGEK
jgi:large subunit ribosomal protein L3